MIILYISPPNPKLQHQVEFKAIHKTSSDAMILIDIYTHLHARMQSIL